MNSYITLQELSNFMIAAGSPVGEIGDSNVIADLITADESSDFKSDMADGVNYYQCQHDILDEDFTKYIDENGVVRYQKDAEGNEIKANNRLVYNYIKRMVDEKMFYLLESPITITYETDKTGKTVDEVRKILGNDFDDTMIDWGTKASNKGCEWIHFYIKEAEADSEGNLESGKLGYMLMPAEQIIAIYETSKQVNLVQLIRYYDVTVNESGKEATRKWVEWWYPDHYDFYKEDANGKFVMQNDEPLPHFTSKNTATNEETTQSWGRIPFICLQNNSYKMTDLKSVKSLIDALNKGESIFNNNLEDLQEAIIKATGVSDSPKDLRDALTKFKLVVSSDENADIDALTISIPYEARERASRNLEENIYSIGCGINPNTDKFGNNPSGIALAWLYMPLDLKAGALERKYQKALYEFFWFVCEYIKRNGSIKEINPDLFKFTFNKSMITNESETIDNIMKSSMLLDKQTMLELHPLVENPETVMKRKEQEDQVALEKFQQTQMNSGNEDEDDQDN